MTAEVLEARALSHALPDALGDLGVGPAELREATSASPGLTPAQPAQALPRFSAARFDRLKRGIDVIGATLFLIAAMPVMLLVTLAVLLESGRPVFYRARRVGRDGRPIEVLKFRSMFPDAEARLARLLEEDPAIREEFARTYKIREDPRISKVGRFLRRTSLDEFPQFWNVLTGSMSLVGPRPVTSDELSLYDTEDGGREAYLAVRPGLTGLWQVSGRSETTYEERVALDRRYVAERNLLLDLAILARTPYAVIRGKGAF
jgi:exopolysaccharide production protein ExoY